MKKYLLTWLMFFGVMALAVAQDNAEDEKTNGGRLEAMKVAWLTNKLKLSPEEAQKFWPIYNQYIAEVRKTRSEARTKKTDELKVQEQMLDIRKKYDGEFSKAISKEKVNTFFRAEREFLAEVQKRIMERRQNNQRPLRRNNLP